MPSTQNTPDPADIPPIVLRGPYYETNEGRLLPSPSAAITALANLENPELHPKTDVILGLASLKPEEARGRVERRVDGQIKEDVTLLVRRSIAKCQLETSQDRIADLTAEIQELRKERQEHLLLEWLWTGSRRFHLAPLGFCAALATAAWMLFQRELGNGATLAINSGIQFATGDQSEQAKSLIIPLLAFSGLLLKVLDMLLPRLACYALRFAVLSAGLAAFLVTAFTWGDLAGAAHGPVDLPTLDDNHGGGIERILTCGLFVFAAGMYGLFLLISWSWQRTVDRAHCYGEARTACNGIAAPKEAERAEWVAVREVAQGLLDAEAGIREILLSDSLGILEEEIARRHWQGQADQANGHLGGFRDAG